MFVRSALLRLWCRSLNPNHRPQQQGHCHTVCVLHKPLQQVHSHTNTAQSLCVCNAQVNCTISTVQSLPSPTTALHTNKHLSTTPHPPHHYNNQQSNTKRGRRQFHFTSSRPFSSLSSTLSPISTEYQLQAEYRTVPPILSTPVACECVNAINNTTAFVHCQSNDYMQQSNMSHSQMHNTNAESSASGEGSTSACECESILNEIQSTAAASFQPKRVLVLTKLTRLEFERRTNPLLTEEELKQVLRKRGSDYDHLLERHDYHHEYLKCIVRELGVHQIEHRVLHRFDYTEEQVQWADAVFTAGGDGTFLLAASKMFDPYKPLIGINTDPVGSEGYMCLMNKLTSAYFPSALKRLLNGDFQWHWRHRIRITLTGGDAWSEPIELHNQALLHPEHRWLDHVREAEESSASPVFSRQTSHRNSSNKKNSRSETEAATNTNEHQLCNGLHHALHPPQRPNEPCVLPYLALNEVFLGESVSSRVSYFETFFDGDKTGMKQKNSGITLCTGTGSTSWYFSINRISEACVRDLLHIINSEAQTSINANDEKLVDNICRQFNDKLLFAPDELSWYLIGMAYTIRDPINNATFKCDQPRGFIQRAEIKSRCFDAHLVIDGGMSYAFNNGTRVTLEIRPRDALRTVVFR